jgi:flagellar P-ring protein precursor FlgI
MKTFTKCLVAALWSLALVWDASAAVRIKDVTSLEGVRDNQIIGYGLVVGLKGSGDTMRNSPFTEQSLQSMLDSMGVNVRNANLRTRNVAAVVVTANFPAFIKKGARIDVNVSSLGDASSLSGGTLIATPLMGSDGKVYAVAQGGLAVAGFSEQGQAQSLSEGIATSGMIPNGAIVERELDDDFINLPSFVLQLSNPDFNTAVRIADAINAFSRDRYGLMLAKERDFRSVVLQKPGRISATRFIAQIEGLNGRERWSLATMFRSRRLPSPTAAWWCGSLRIPSLVSHSPSREAGRRSCCHKQTSLRRKTGAPFRSLAAPICRPSSVASTALASGHRG